jgi:2-polyprenyl-6-methoxyphenol hydroxylase-like FAD-dependent oxidoreductase
VVLSELLAGTADTAQAFRHYESARRRRVRRIVRDSAMLGRFIQAPPPLGPYLHHLARITPKRLLLRHIADIGGYDAMG